MNEPIISRVYDLKVQGYDAALKNLNAITAAFTKMDETKRKTDEQLKKAVEAGNAAAIDKLVLKVKELEASLKNLDKQREQSAKEVELLAKAEKIEADTKLTNAKATTEQAKAEAVRTKSIIDQEKELDRQIALEDKKAKADAKNSADAKVQANNYYALLQVQRLALEAYRITPSDSPFFNQVKQGATEAKAKVDAFNRSLSPDGTLVGEYKTGIINAFKTLGLGDFIQKQKIDLETQLNSLIQKNQHLAQEYKQASAAGGEAFAKIDLELKESIRLQQQMEANLQHINAEFATTGGIGSQITQSLSNEFKNLKTNIAQMAVSYLGFQAVLSGTTNLIHQNAELSDSVAQLQIYLKGSKVDAENLVEQLKKIDTRTSLAGLVDIGTIVAKKGVAKDEIAGVTNALDQLFVTLGKEVGDPHEAVGSLVKLVNVYSEDKHVTAKNIGDIGAAIQKLTSSGVATGAFLINFSERLAGVRGITGITIQNVLGLGAALQELGQRNESAATAAQKLILDMFLKPAQYAKAAGESVSQFSKELASSPVEALIKVAAALKKPGAATEELVASFSEMGIKGARVIGVLGDIAGNSEYMRKRVDDANKSFGDQDSIVAANTIKQNTFAATLDKISKQFELLGANKSVQVVLGVVVSTLALILGNIIPIISALGLYGLAWLTVAKEVTIAGEVTAVTNGQMLLLRIQIAASNVLLGIFRLYTIAATIAQTAYNAVIYLYTGIATGAAAATTFLGAAMRLLPIGFILAALGLVVGIFRALASEVNGSTAALRAQALQQKINAEIQKEAAAATSNQRAEATLLVAVVKDLSISEETRNATLKKLLELDPLFQKALVDGKLNYQELDKALTAYNAKLLQSAELEASKARQSKEFGKLTDLQGIKQEIEIAQKAGKGFGDLSDEAQKAFSKVTTSVGRTNIFSSLVNATIGKDDFKTAISDLNKEINRQLQNVDAAQAVYLDKQKSIDAGLPKATIATPVSPAGTVFDQFKNLVKNGGTEEQFSDLMKQIEEQKKNTALLSTEYKNLNDLQQKVKDLLDPKKAPANTKGSRLTGEQKDVIKDIDAARDEQLAAEKLKYSKLEESEQQYLQNILKINIAAADAKLAFIKGKNAEERKTIAELQLYKIEQEQETNKKLFDLQSKSIERSIDDAKKQAQAKLDVVKENPLASTLDKLKAKETFLSTELVIEAAGNEKIDALEKRYGVQSLNNEKKRRDALLAINRDLAKTQFDILYESFNDQTRLIKEAGDRNIAEFKNIINTQREAILNSNKPEEQKQAGLTSLDKLEATGTLAREVATLKQQLPSYQKALAEKRITEKEYADFYAAYIAKLTALNDNLNGSSQKVTDVNSFLQSNLKKLFGFIEGSNQAKVFGDTVAQTFDLAKAAMADYYDAERANIERSNQLQHNRIELQKQQQLDGAQSEAERESITRQAQAKSEAANREAFEKNKKLQLEQAKINLAIQLSNLAVIAFAPNPLNIATLGIAGGIMYAVQAGLALAGYALNVGRINSAKYAVGGYTGMGTEKDSTGHRVAGIVHNDEWVSPKWMVEHPTYGRVIQQLETVRMKGYADGGFTGTGNFKLGDSLQAPINPGAFFSRNNGGSNSNTDAQISALANLIAETSRQTNQRIDKIKVAVVAGEVDVTNNKTKKATVRGTV
jgi:hypothetical protein